MHQHVSWVYNLGLNLYIAWLLKLMVARNADTIINEISSDIYGRYLYCLSFSFYEQLKLHFPTNLTEGLESIEKNIADISKLLNVAERSLLL